LIPNALSIAGIDPSGGAGIYADLKTFSALGAYGMGVVAALTAQNTQAVTGIHGVPPEFVRLQLDTVFADVTVHAVKIGMLGTAPIARAVAEGLARPLASVRGGVDGTSGFAAGTSGFAAGTGGAAAGVVVVVDPVMVAKSGDTLLDRDATTMLVEAILPLATVVTPNLPEAGVLLRERAPETLREMSRAVEKLRRLLPDSGRRWVLLKGGHLSGDAIDLLHDGDVMIELPERRIETKNTHGTGCTLSAAIAALAPQSEDMPAAVREAKRYLTEAIRRSGDLTVGVGHGPVSHFHRWWPR
jgi:hydroxymethylpyrimidine/phosphomethylpyrimidine kinase